MPSQQPAKPKAFKWVIGGLVAAVVIVTGALIVNAVESNEKDRQTAVPSFSSGMGQPIVLGEANAPSTVTIFEDFQCPYCKALGKLFSNPVDDGVSAGVTKVEYFPVAFLGPGSSIASNAAACAADQGKFYEYHQALFGHQPDKSSGDQFTEDLILSLSESTQVPDLDQFKECVSSNRYGTWVESLLKAMEKNNVTSTPTMFINGKAFDLKASSQADLAVAIGLIPAPTSTPKP